MKKTRILIIVDTHSRFCPETDSRFSYRGEDVVQTLEKVCGNIEYPKTIRVNNGSEFISRDLDLWAYANNVTLDFSRRRCGASLCDDENQPIMPSLKRLTPSSGRSV